MTTFFSSELILLIFVICCSVQHNYEAQRRAREERIQQQQQQLDQLRAQLKTNEHSLEQFRLAVNRAKESQYKLKYVFFNMYVYKNKNTEHFRKLKN